MGRFNSEGPYSLKRGGAVKHKKATMVGVAGIVGVTCAVGAIAEAHHHHGSPSAAEIEFARGTSDLMTNTVVAALLQEINETTPENVAQGNLSIGLIFNDHNRDMRLVGRLQPLSRNDYPSDSFERRALDLAMSGTPTTSVDQIQGRYYYRRSIPLSNFQPQCAMCHSNFNGLPSTAWVGALMLRVPIDND
jgi:hypothetical protein